MDTATGITEIRPQPGPQEQFLSSPADVAIYGGGAGGGKSYALLLDPLRAVRKPGFRGAIVRRTYEEITDPGALWDESAGLYPLIGGIPNRGRLEWRFEPDATIAFRNCNREADVYKWHGTQVDFLGIDEATHLTRKQAFYLMTRVRGRSGVNPYVRMTCNPDADSWLAEFLAWWIDQDTGYPIPERAGVLRYFVIVNDQVHWGDSDGELRDRLAFLGEEIEPKSCTFIPASLEDNPALLDNNPGYRASLLAQRTVDQERLLRGNWKITDDEGAEWPAEYFEEIWADRWPDAFELSVVAVDPSLGKTAQSDFSAIVFAGLFHGRIYVMADLARRPASQIVTDLVNFAADVQPDSIAIESASFQELLIGDVEDYIRRNGPLFWPVVGLKTGGIEKSIRIKRLGAYLQAGKIKLRRSSEGCHLLLGQLRGFPRKGVHDDGPDALEMAIRQLNDLARAALIDQEAYA